MIRRIFLWCVMAVTVVNAAEASSKVIRLKDGSQIVGEIMSVSDGKYTIKTENLGEVVVGDENILSIQAEGTASNEVAPNESPLKQQVQSVQHQIMGDENIMGSINALAEDKEIHKLLQDPNLVNTIKSFDLQSIGNDPAVQEMLKREDVQEIIKQIMTKLEQDKK